MFKKKTVFIVGAGASKEVGLPIGDELKLKIGVKLDIRFDNGYDLSAGDPKIVEAVRHILHEKQERDINPHCQAGRIIASAMHQALSIDNFLHTHSDNELIVQMGKLGIAATIMEAESSSKISGDQRRYGQINFASHPDIWHNTFCKMLCEGVQTRGLEKLFENVSFITFNYDRCIEHYVSQWVSNYMQIPLPDAQELTGKLTVIHPYGQVGRLPWQRNGLTSVPYGSSVEGQTLPKIASHIRTFTEQVEDETVPEKMRELIEEAQQVVYLGFSYGSMNMDLMRLRRRCSMKTVRGTALGIAAPNMSAITDLINSTMYVMGEHFMGTRSFDAVTCNQLLNDYFRTLA